VPRAAVLDNAARHQPATWGENHYKEVECDALHGAFRCYKWVAESLANEADECIEHASGCVSSLEANHDFGQPEAIIEPRTGVRPP
jgi:hypothetical protein